MEQRDLLYAIGGDPIVNIQVRTVNRVHLFDFVTWEVEHHAAGDALTIFDATSQEALAAYPPGGWTSVEALRFYRKGDDPPEAET